MSGDFVPHRDEPAAAPPAAPRLRLTDTAVAKPALLSQVRPALVLAEKEARDLLQTATAYDVTRGGRFSAGPAGIQVWSGPWDGPNGTHGQAVHLGSVDWSYDTPVRHYATVYRAMVTTFGLDAGESTSTILDKVLRLAGLSADGCRLEMPMPPARDPFRNR